MARIKTKSGCQTPALLFITGVRGEGENSLNYLVFFKEWVVFVLLLPFGIYRTYYPTHEIKTTSFCDISTLGLIFCVRMIADE